MRSTKDTLHRLVDELPDSEIRVAERFLQYLRVTSGDLVLCALLEAPLDDEPTTPEEDAGAEQAWQEYLRGQAMSAEDAKRALLP